MKKRIPLSQVVKEITTTDGIIIKVMDTKNQCGLGDCLCQFAFIQDEQDKRDQTVTIMLCEHHKDEK